MSQSRLFHLVYHLLEHGQTSAPALAEKFEVSVRTVYRDVEALSAAGVPIYTMPGRNGGVALMDHFVLNRAALSGEEQEQLLTALKSLSGDSGLGSEETLSKLSALFRRPEPDWLQVDLSHWGDVSEANARFQQLKEAILDHRVISFSYVSSYGETTAREVLPARLVFKGQAWYLQGFCLDREAYRTFRLSRMLALTVTERTFSTPLSPPPIQGSGDPPPTVTLHLRFPPSMAYRVYDEFDGGQIKALPDGTLEVFASFPEDGWVYGYLLSFGASVEVLTPSYVRENLAALAKESFLQHEKHDR